MTNFQIYKSEIMKVIETGYNVAHDNQSDKIVACKECIGRKCSFYKTAASCSLMRAKWYREKYKEKSQYSDWKIDERIEVSDDGVYWYRGYFSGIDAHGYPTTWFGGKTSWTCKDREDWRVSWRFAKKASADEVMGCKRWQ